MFQHLRNSRIASNWRKGTKRCMCWILQQKRRWILPLGLCIHNNLQSRYQIPCQNRASDEAISSRLRDRSKIKMPSRFYVNHISVIKAIETYGDDAKNAIISEIRQLFIEKGAMHPVVFGSIPSLVGFIRSSVVVKAKYDAAGRFQKVKARIVANGAQQNRELYDFISAPTVDPEDVMMTLAIAAKYKYFVTTMDIGGAYLNASMVDEVYVEFSPLLSQYILSVCPQYASFLHQNKLYVQLDRALYGCIQSARLWYNTIAKFLLEIGFTKSLTDECVFHIQFNQQKMIVTI
jgi:hypothetical protein